MGELSRLEVHISANSVAKQQSWPYSHWQGYYLLQNKWIPSKVTLFVLVAESTHILCTRRSTIPVYKKKKRMVKVEILIKLLNSSKSWKGQALKCTNVHPCLFSRMSHTSFRLGTSVACDVHWTRSRNVKQGLATNFWLRWGCAAGKRKHVLKCTPSSMQLHQQWA